VETPILRIETPQSFHRSVAQASELLRAGEIVAVPTETVYGLAANALNSAAVRKIYEAKGRPAYNPIIVHVASLSMARQHVRAWPEIADILAAKFWPGPLTLVLPKSDSVPSVVTAGGETVGIRWPLHPFMQELIRECAFPIAAPSANLANQLSPTTGDHVFQSLGGRIPLIVDAGPSSIGLESTVLDLTSIPLRVLRPGMISAEQISDAIGLKVVAAGRESAILKSPGMLRKHYSPRARLIISAWASDAELEKIARGSGTPLSRIHILAHERIPHSNPYGRVAVIPHDPEAYARALYAELHRSDQLNAALILVEAPPPESHWDAIRDRLRRASGNG
jgi:L-threonylcarbamoyladenylate synthase